MKFSTTFTLAALMLMSSGTDARIGGNQRELHSHSRKEKKCDPNIAGQCFTNGKYTGSDCKNVKLGGSRPDYRCVGPAPSKSNAGQCMKRRRDLGHKEKKCDPNIAGQCFTNGKYMGSDCKNVKLGGSRPDFRCVGPAPAPGPKEKKCDPNIAGQCFTNGKYTGSDCKNVKLGGSRPDFRCVGPAPAPAPKKPIKCHTDQNPTYTPECPSGYTCEPI